jgi:energy-coupling factor transport system substrate-specific component
MMKKNGKWPVKDVITTVLLSVLLILIQLGINMICMLNYFISMVLSVGISCLICAPIYFLLVRRVHKRFVSLAYTTLLGLAFLIAGDWFVLPYFFAIGIICELILWKKDSCDNFKKISAAWITYSVLYIGINILPLWFFWTDYEQNALAGGMKPEYIASYISYYSNPVWLAAIVLITASCGLAGSIFAGRMMKKHFAPPGEL